MNTQPTQPKTLTVGQEIKCEGYKLRVTKVKASKPTKYTLVKHPQKNTRQLQGIGNVVGEEAKNIKVGDVLMWNFGAILS